MTDTDIQNLMIIANVCSISICFCIGFLCNEFGSK